GDVVAMYFITTEPPKLIATYEYDEWGKVKTVRDATGAILTDLAHLANRNPFRYRSYHYDIETGFYYLQSRYYDPVISRFINADSYGSTGQAFLGTNMFAYCNNNPVNLTDPSGHFGIAAAIIASTIVAITLSACSSNATNSTSSKRIKYDVPLYSQGKTNLCWAYCQVMVEEFQSKIGGGQVKTQSEAEYRAIQIANSVNSVCWNSGNRPQNISQSIAAKDITSIDSLYEYLQNGPIYAGFASSPEIGHIVVVTGVDLETGVVYTNNSWGICTEQTFSEFKYGLMADGKQMPLIEIMLINY
ncbi:MAG: hypothetical protein HFF17_13375, partial [Oscillospiraceae bacterium]|nr:hypothetical protein [Oscillospiraceae bacterium]